MTLQRPKTSSNLILVALTMFLTLFAASESWAAISVRQVSTPAISPSPTIGGRATSFSSLPLPGSTIIVIGTWYIDSLTGSFAVTDNKSNSYSLVVSAPETLVGDDIATQIWRTTAGIADPVSGTFTVTMTSPYSGQSLGNIVALEVTHDGDLITDRIVRATAESATPSVGPTSTLSQADEVIVAAVTHAGYVPGNIGATRPATTGYTAALTVQDGDAGVHGFADYKIVSATTAVSAAWGTFAQSAAWQAAIATFYEDGGGEEPSEITYINTLHSIGKGIGPHRSQQLDGVLEGH